MGTSGESGSGQDGRTYVGTYQDRREDAAVQEYQNADGPFSMINALPELTRDLASARTDSQQYSAQQQQALTDAGVQTREAPAMPGTYYPGYDHPTMKGMVNDNMDPGQVNEAGAAWNNLGNSLLDFETAMRSAVTRSSADWTGQAGDAAREYLSGLGTWMGGTGQSFHLAANHMHAQSEAAGAAKAAMPEPVDFTMDDAMAMMEQAAHPIVLEETRTQVDQRFGEKQQAHDEAVRVMTGFSQSLADSGGGMPQFAPAPRMGGGTGDDGFSDSEIGDGRDPGYREPGDRPGTFGDDGQDGTTGFPQTRPAEVPPGTGGTWTQGFDNRPAPVPPTSLPPGGGPGGGSGGGYPGVPPTGFSGPGGLGGERRGPGFGRGGPGQGGPGAGRAGLGGPGLGGPGSGGPGARAGFGPGGPGGGAGAPVAGGPATGARPPGALAANHAAAGRGGGGAAGSRGAGGGMGGMGAGAGARGGEDGEHQRPSYLVEADPDDVFGTDEITAPPVIGQ